MAIEERRSVSFLVFDIDDTLYPVSNGFTEHRHYEVLMNLLCHDFIFPFFDCHLSLKVAITYMTERLGFADASAAISLRDKYFKK